MKGGTVEGGVGLALFSPLSFKTDRGLKKRMVGGSRELNVGGDDNKHEVFRSTI